MNILKDNITREVIPS